MSAIRRGQRIRVCFAVDAPYAGGAERYISLIARGIDPRLFEPVVLARAGAGLEEWARDLSSSGVPVVRIPMDMPFRPADAVRVLAALRKIDPVVVHVNAPGPYDGQMGLLAPLSRVAGSAGVLVTEHLPRVERLWKRALVKAVSYQWVDRVLTVCRANVAHLTGIQRVPRHKIDVVYNGVAASYGSLGRAERENTRRKLGLEAATIGLVFVGSLIARKGVGVLLDAVAGMALGDWRLLVVGRGAGEEEFRRRASDGGLDGRVRFLGALAEDEVERVLCASDILVLPSFMEGMPYVILEAMACSLPVIATRVDGIPEAAPDGEAALLVPAGDTAALRAAVERLAAEAELRAKLGESGRRRFERLFTLDRHIAKMESVYVGMVAGER